MVSKTGKKVTKREPAVKKVTKREPSQSAMMKKVATVSDSNKMLQKEIKTMVTVFQENQKILISMKKMIDILSSTMEHIQMHARELNKIERDTQKLYADMNQIKTQGNLVEKINHQTSKLQDEIRKVSETQKAPKSGILAQQLECITNSVNDNARIIKKVSERTDTFSDLGSRIDIIRRSIDKMSNFRKNEEHIQSIDEIRQEFKKIIEDTVNTQGKNFDLDAIKKGIIDISTETSKMDMLKNDIRYIKQQSESNLAKMGSVQKSSLEFAREIAEKIDTVETRLESGLQDTDLSSTVTVRLKAIQEMVLDFKQGIFEKNDSMEQKMAEISNSIKTHDTSMSEVYKRSKTWSEEISAIKDASGQASDESTGEIISLLRLSEFQSVIRMNAESKYGSVEDLEKMASQMAGIVNMFDRIPPSDSKNSAILLLEVKRWAISKILDCANKWEVRFGDVYAVLAANMDVEKLKECIRVDQVRDIYGMRAVEEMKKDIQNL